MPPQVSKLVLASSCNRRTAATLALGFVILVSSAHSAEPLSARIDAAIESGAVGPLAPLADDAEFVRRIYLDLAGTIPTSAEARAFLDDTSPGKRAALVDRLLAAPEFARRMQYVFDTALMERRPEKYVPAGYWQEFLRTSFEQNKPYDQLVREILSADGTDEKNRPAARFYLDRDAEAPVLTRDVARLFLGRDMQCAQCHDHPLVAAYYQDDYYGINAFFARTSLFTDKDKKVFLAEKADGETNYKSVFTGDARDNVPPRLPGCAPIAEPKFDKGQEYVVAPADNVRPVPKFSRRAELAKAITDPGNVEFKRNIVNRLWAQMMGRGLVDPVDLHHADNPPSHPAVLALIADEFVAMKFDVRALLRELALTRTYQRASDIHGAAIPPADALASKDAQAEGEAKQLAEAVAHLEATGKTAATELAAARKSAQQATSDLDAVRKLAADAKAAADTSAAALAKARQDLAAKRDVAAALGEAAAKALAAAAKLPDDKPLAAAAEQFKTRAAEIAAAVAPLEQAVPPAEVAAKQATDRLAAADKVVAEKSPVAESAKQLSATKLAAARTIEQQLSERRAAADVFSTRRADFKRLLEYHQLLAASQTTQAELDKAAAELLAARTAVPTIEASIAPAQQAVATAKQASDTAAAAQTAAEQAAAPKREASQAVVEASNSTAAAAAKLPGDATLAQAAAQLKAKSDELAADLATAEKVVAEHAAAAKSAAEQLAAAQAAAAKAEADVNAAREAVKAREQAQQAANEKLAAARSAVDAKLAEVADRASELSTAAVLKPLSPEQLAWSMAQATGLLSTFRAAAEAELAKQNQPDPKLPPAEQQVQRARLLEKGVHDKLASTVSAFVSVFGGASAASQDFQATVQQALFVANNGAVTGWLAPGGGNLAERLVAAADPAALADELYLSVLTRRPDDSEKAAVAEYLSQPGLERPAAVQELIWSLLSSNEFRFNH